MTWTLEENPPPPPPTRPRREILAEAHRLSEIDPERGMAVCSKCGSVRVYPLRKKKEHYKQSWVCSQKNLEFQRIHRHRLHGLSDEEFQALWDHQEGRCPCGEPLVNRERDKSATFHLDHDHTCCPGARGCPKCIRGILCGTCNIGIGMLGHNPVRLRALADYLEAIR